MVEMDGDEMTRIIWAFIKEKVMVSCPRNGRVCQKWGWGSVGGTGDPCAALCLSLCLQETGHKIGTAARRTLQ